jgi:hypothetical protein
MQAALLGGDLLTLGLVTVFGFATHSELESAGLRMLTTFVPLTAAWLLVAPHLGAFDLNRTASWRELWRPFWAMVLAGPMAAWLRSVWLGTPVIPIFVPVLGGVAALSLLAWRAVFWVIQARGAPAGG